MKRIGLFLFALTLFVGANAANSTVNMDSLKNEIVRSSKEIMEQKKDSIMFSKLSAEQILELKRGEQEVKKKEIDKEGRNEMPLNGAGIVLICLLPFLFVIVILIIQSKARNRESQRRYDIYMKSIEIGQTVPEHFFDEPKKSNASSNLKKGILWMVVGIAIVISFLVMNKTNGLIVGIVPAFVGVGYLLVHMLDKPKTDSTVKSDEQHG
jgi:hypothetical protein